MLPCGMKSLGSGTGMLIFSISNILKFLSGFGTFCSFTMQIPFWQERFPQSSLFVIFKHPETLEHVVTLFPRQELPISAHSFTQTRPQDSVLLYSYSVLFTLPEHL